MFTRFRFTHSPGYEICWKMFENWQVETIQQRAKRGEVLSIEIKTKKIESLRQSQAILMSRVTQSVVQNKASNIDGRTKTSQELVEQLEDKYRYYCIYTIFVVASQHTGNGRMKDFQLLG